MSLDIAPIQQALPNLAKKNMTGEQAEKVSKDFESMFISQMTEQMFGESSGQSAFGTGDTDEIYKGLMVQEYGKIMTQAGGIGIASYVKRELLRMQEVPQTNGEKNG